MCDVLKLLYFLKGCPLCDFCVLTVKMIHVKIELPEEPSLYVPWFSHILERFSGRTHFFSTSKSEPHASIYLLA